MSDLREWNENEVAELKKIFYAQAYEIVESLQDALLMLESEQDHQELLKTIKRHVHTLKGDANSIGLASIGTLCHRMEDVLARLENEDGQRDREAIDILFGAIDTVHAMLTKSEAGREAVQGDDILHRIGIFLHGALPTMKQTAIAVGAPATEYQELQLQDALKRNLHVYTLDVGFHSECGSRSAAALLLTRRLQESGTIIRSEPELESLDADAGATLTITFSTELGMSAVEKEAQLAGMTGRIVVKRHESAAEARQVSNAGSKTEVLRIDASKVDVIMDLVGELIIARSMIDQVAREIENGSAPDDLETKIQSANAFMDRAVSDLQKGVMKMRMVPVYHVFKKFPKMVRDLSLDKSKKVRIELFGKETEIDKAIVDALGEPLAHIIRNAVDHGIEPPGERRSAGKPEEGTILLRAYQEASQIVIEVADDGRGIDRAKLKQKAIEERYVTAEDAEKLSDTEAVNLIFLSGLSTANTVSEISGRGVGMEAVRSAVESLKGSIECETSPGRGSVFRLRLPLTLAVINVLLFEVGTRLYAVPLAAIAEVAAVNIDSLVTIEGRKTLLLRDEIISIISVEELFRIEGSGKKKKHVLIIGTGGRKTGLLIDRLLWQEELVIKAIDERRMQTEFVAGASILGSGKVVFILDVHSLLRKAIEAEKQRGMAMPWAN